MLLNSKMSIHSIDPRGRTPLELACQLGDLDIIKALIEDTVQDDKGTIGDKLLKIALNYEKDEVILFIITKLKCDPNIKGESPLHVACKKGNLSLVRTLIRDYYADLNDKDPFGNTPFTLALEYERDEVMLVLISEFGCDPTNIKGRYGVPRALNVACKKGNLSLVRTLIHDCHADLNNKDSYGKTPFVLALENERDEVMLVLISEFGYDPTNIKGRYGVSPLHVACKKGNLSLVRTLIHDYYADINDRDALGGTPFTRAIDNERDEVMLVLISEFGCDPTNIKNKFVGESPLHVACKNCNLDLIRILIRDYNADLNNKDSYGETPFVLALENEGDEVMLVLISEFGYDPTNIKGRNGISPLHVACKKGNFSLVRTLICDYHADLNDKDIYGYTPITLAIENERNEVMLVLISEFGCDPTNIKGVSPLHVACKKGNLSLVRTLICDYHADLNDKDSYETPFTLALNNWRDEVMLVLISEFEFDPTNIKGALGVSPLHVACEKGNLSLVRTLIRDYHADINDKNSYGETPFTLALDNWRDEVMLVLISEFGCDPTNVKGGYGVSPLHVACKKGNLSLVRTLICDYHADLNDKDPFGTIPFTLALENKRDEVMLVLISEFGYDPTNIKGRNGVSPLHIACKKGNLSLVRTLICDYHADINDKDPFGETPFTLALENERDEVMLVLISEFGYDPTNIKGKNGVSPLHVACKKGNLSLVRTLIRDYHADLNNKDIFYNTPITFAIENERNEVMLVLINEFATNIKRGLGVSLHVACKKGNLSLVRTLIYDYNADINHEDSHGKTPFVLALENEKDEVMLILISEFWCDPTNIKGRYGVSPLHVSCKKGNLSLVRTLIRDYHADINHEDSHGKTPFVLALENEKDEVMLILISEFGCDPTNIKGRYGVSPLHVACKKGNLSLVRTLIRDYHADINHEDSHGKTPFVLALKYEKDEVMLVLISEYGCDPTNIKGRGISPLHVACKKGNLSLVRTLIHDYHADLNDKDPFGKTPFTLALEYERDEVMLVLINEFGYDPSKIKYSLLLIACKKGNFSLLKTLVYDYHMDLNDKDCLNFKMALENESDEIALGLFDYGYDPKAKDEHGRSLLHIACEKGRLGVVRALILNQHLELDDQDSDGNTPLVLAAKNGREEVVLASINEFGCDPNNKDSKGRSLLHVALYGGWYGLSKTLINNFNFDFNGQDDCHETPLTLVIKREREIRGISLESSSAKFIHSLLKELLLDGKLQHDSPLGAIQPKQLVSSMLRQFNIDPNLKDFEGGTLLHLACREGRIDVVHTLIQTFKAELNIRDDHNDTPLMKAVEYGRCETVKSLISDYGCDISIKGSNGYSLLHIAIVEGHMEMFEMLVSEFEMSPIVIDGDDNTPLMLAMKKEKNELVLALLEKYSCGPNTKDNEGNSPLHVACMKGDLSLVQTLITHGADLNALDEHGYTPLMTAVKYRNSEVVKLLHDHGCDINVTASNGWSLLHIAVSKGHIEMLKMLVSKIGMSPLVVDEAGDTPLHVCAKLGHYDCVRSLLEDFQSPIYIRNRAGKTPIDVALGNVKPLFDDYLSHSSQAIQADYQTMQQLAKKKFSGAHHIAKLFVVGHPRAGKSSLVEALKREGFFISFSRVSEKSVPPHTAGIVPSIHTSPSYGRLQFYDFAGDPEYYSSHAAILEKIFQSKIGTTICIIVLDLQENDEEIEKKFLYWSIFISNNCRNPQNRPFLLVIGSHSDLLPNQREVRRKNDFIQSIISKYDKESVYFSLDCCYPRSDNLYALRKHIKTISEKSKPYSLSQETSVLLGLLEKDFQSVTACSAHVLVHHINLVGLCLPKFMTHLHPLLLQLQDIGELLIVGGEKDDSYLILNISQLTNEVHKKLFSKEPDSFPRKPDDLSFNIGLLPESFLQEILPEHITRECLIQLQYCQEISPVEIDPDYSILPSPEPSDAATSLNQSVLFFPALCTVEWRDISWLIPPTSYSIGWLARCSRPRDYFPPRFLHVLLLRIALKFTVLAPSSQAHHVPAGIKRQCFMWKTGVHWVMEEGVECTVELLNTNKVLVMTLRGYEEHASEKYSEIMTNIISCVMEAKTEFCHSIQPDFFLLDSTDEGDYLNKDNLFSMSTVENFLLSPEGKEIIISDNRKKIMSCKRFVFMRKLIYWYSLFPIEFFPVFQLLNKISAKWHDLGLYLCLPKNILDVIQEENSSVQKRLKEMVSAWMNSSLDPPCWWQLAKALRDMEMGRLADEIERNHGQLVKCSLTPLSLYIIPPQVTTLKCRRSSLIQSAMLRDQMKSSWSCLLVWWGPSGHPWPPFCP